MINDMETLMRLMKELRANGRIDVVRLANKLNIGVRPIDDFTEILKSAYLKKEGDNKFVIYVNGNQSKQRQRFSIAHEIAHHFLHQNQLNETGVLERNGTASLSPAEEQEADKLAAQILMPDADLEEYLRERGIQKGDKVDNGLIQELCDRYDVSFYAMIVRLREARYYVPFIKVYDA